MLIISPLLDFLWYIRLSSPNDYVGKRVMWDNQLQKYVYRLLPYWGSNGLSMILCLSPNPPLLACHWRLGRGYTCAISFSHHRYNIFSVRHRRPHGHQFHYCAPLLKYILSIDWLIEYAHISLLSLKVEHSNLLGLSYKISKLLKFILSMDHFKYFILFLK